MSMTPLSSSNVQRESGSRGEGGEARGGGTWEQMSVQNAAALPPPLPPSLPPSLPHGSSFHSPARSDFPSLAHSSPAVWRRREEEHQLLGSFHPSHPIMRKTQRSTLSPRELSLTFGL